MNAAAMEMRVQLVSEAGLVSVGPPVDRAAGSAGFKTAKQAENNWIVPKGAGQAAVPARKNASGRNLPTIHAAGDFQSKARYGAAEDKTIMDKTAGDKTGRGPALTLENGQAGPRPVELA